MLLDQRGDLLELAGADEIARVRAPALAKDVLDRVAARGQHQLFEFARIFAIRFCGEVQVNEQRALTGIGSFKKQSET